jgi:REP element-mobilizing transposase RayT
MILASHVIISAYGFWLPNDPRGSWSDFVRSWELYDGFGPATKVDHSRSVARAPHDIAKRLAAKKTLQYPAVKFTGIQARAIAQAFAFQCQKSGIIIHACSILPRHVHLVIARHRYHVEQAVNLLKGRATRFLSDQKLHPFQNMNPMPSPWGVGLWKVFLDSPEDVLRSIRYVERNPLHEGKAVQKWWFTKPFMQSEEPGPADRR